MPGLLIPAFSRIFVDNVLVGGLDELAAAAAAGDGRCARACCSALTWLQQYVLLRLGQKLAARRASSRFFWHVLRLPIEFFDLRYAADVASRTQLNDRIAQLLSARPRRRTWSTSR